MDPGCCQYQKDGKLASEATSQAINLSQYVSRYLVDLYRNDL